jgi:hypothetical protein
MPNTLTQSKARNVSTVTTVYTVPASTTATLTGLLVSNVDASATVTVDVSVGDGSEYHIVKNLPILVGSSIELVEGKIIMLTTETLKVTSTGGNVDVIASYLEQS